MNPGPEAPQQDPAAAPVETDAAAESERPRGGPSWLLLGGVALLVMLLVRGFLVQSFYVPSGSMEPTIEPGDRILVNKLADGDSVRRGDVVVFDGTTTFAAADLTPHQDDGAIGRVLGDAASLVGVHLGEQDFVKRVIGLPGDHVVCCDRGSLTVNGKVIDETYVMPGDKPSELEFDVTVPAGRLWVMGDHRSDSADSRSHLGDPGGGTVRLSDVIGRASATYWPLSRLGRFERPDALADLPRVGEP
ncbi:signal peptidase I [Phycicoccus sp. Soil803]|uniref:signal peptidase I n=1 Tax=Phycicoccus sp. Soil803 TaxID=1736415 RepID=UPI0009E8FA98|nr:signal peptidase I [Phycicoccus sp. Soil803]